MDSQPLDDELLRLTGGNPKIVQALRDGLQEMSRNRAHPELAEMARDLIAGRTTLRQLGQSDVYGNALTDAVTKFKQLQADLPPEERARLERQAREQFTEPEPERP